MVRLLILQVNENMRLDEFVTNEVRLSLGKGLANPTALLLSSLMMLRSGFLTRDCKLGLIVLQAYESVRAC